MGEDILIQVVTFKWDTGTLHPKKKIKFSTEHVNRLFRMINRNTTVCYEPVCITDDPTGLDPHIRVIPLWDDFRDMGGCYVRLRAFAEDMRDLIGPKFIWLDLDAVICGNIDHILTDKSTFKAWGDTHPKTFYNGSMIMMESGSREQVWGTFNRNCSPKEARARGFVGTDQAWISNVLGPHEPKWGMGDGVYSFRCHLEKKRNTLPDNACIVMFHGRNDPSMPHIQSKYPWVKEHWR